MKKRLHNRKKRTTFLYSLCLMLLCANVGFAQGPWNFPTDIQSWVVQGSSAVSWDGTVFNNASGSLKTVTTAITAGAKSPTFTPTIAGNYIFSAYIKGTAGDKVRLDIFQGSASVGTDYTLLTSNFELVTRTVTVVGGTNMTLRILDRIGSKTLYIDDVSFTYVPPAGSILTTNVIGGGTVTKSPDQPSYTAGSVTVNAIQKTHWLFSTWSGDLTGTTNPESVPLDGTTNKTVTANFIVDPAFNYAFNYNLGTDLEGWAPDAAQLTASVSGGIATLTPTANQFARFSLLNFPIPSANYNKVTLVLKNNSATTNELAIIAGATTGNVTTITTSDAGYQTYVIDLTANAGWTGSVTSFKIRFANSTNSGKPSDAGTIEIDSIIFSYTYPTTYYYKGVGSLASLASWSSKEDGSGAAPINFTADGITYRISTSVATDASWTVSGVGSKVIFGKSTAAAVTLTVADTFPIIGTIDVTAASTGSNSVLWQDATTPSFGSLNTNSEVHFQKSATFTFSLVPTFGKLFIDNSSAVTFGAGIKNVTTSLTIGSGSSLATGDGLILKSTATKTAVVAPVLGSITGNVTVERNIPASQRAYRLLSPAVTTSTFIDANWQLGTHITGTGGATNGFDVTTSNGSSMFIHNNTTPAWVAVGNTNATVLTAGVPYLIYIRGSRTASLTVVAEVPPVTIASDATTLSATGVLTTGNVTVNGLNETANGFSAVGNPYQAQVDMQAVLASATNLNNGFYYVVDPALGTKGGYLTVDVTAAATAEISKNLQPGQACFVQTLAAGPASLTFTEANKTEASAQTNIFKVKNSVQSGLDLTLFDAASNRLDVLKIAFDASETNAVNQNDASKLTNFDESMATSNNGKLLAIEKRAMPTATDEIPLNITKYRGTSYSLKLQGTGLTATPYLLDTFSGTTTEIPLDGSVDYAFTVDAGNTATSAANRFKLIYAKTLKVIDNATAGFSLYPNPSKANSFNIVIPQGNAKASLTVSNLLGQKLYSQNDLQAGATERITVANVKTAGVYLVSLTSEGKTSTTKWIVE
ncbi:T9SS type A sorting domain-containing protein [Flavobacterium nackdongense]|uniref:T9SS type A sorting domain-containing protein n=1 Tax=Flavobacterium nackdongense TaxID=2547394 RepID=A0A4P6YHS8_9FLAO|nr:T9SS type A sorting domain-containing protein [Flavobacterium nackdongense]QBN20437.1 T9SS type A sorting domain-containing protein [Flavobacterium nackdongense]